MNYDELAQSVAKDYNLFLLALTGRFLQAITPGAEVTPKAITDVERSAAGLRETFLEGATSRLESAMQSQVAELSDGAKNAAERLLTAFLSDLRRVTKDNIVTASKTLRNGRSDFAKMLHGGHGAIGMLIQKKMQQPEYKTTDSAGRSWQAEKYVRFAARDYAYKAYLGATLQDIADSGNDLAEVVYDDPAHLNNGLVFSISGKAKGYPDLALVYTTVFHPNATAKVKAHVSA